MKGAAAGLAVALAALLGACAATDDDAPGQGDAPAGAQIGETGGMCGGIAGFPCVNDGDYCHFKTGECIEIADVAGVCRPKPEICTMEYDPVCGCDGETYSNACMAAASGVSVARKGACAPRE